MSETQNPLDDRNILNLIRTICANGESGRLEILAGAVQGELSFAHGKLVDARFGHLTGFRAINAVAAMRDARISFDPAFSPLASSSITPSERVVLKQFFGIETAAASQYVEPVVADWPEEAAAATTVMDAVDEVTIVSSNAVRADIPDAVRAHIPDVVRADIPPPPPPASRYSYRTALALAVLAMAVMAAAAVLIYKFRDPGSAMVIASAETTSVPAPVQQPESSVVPSTPIHSVPAPVAVKEGPVAIKERPAAVKEAPAAVKESPAAVKESSAAVKEVKKPLDNVQDLSGKWTVINSVDTTAYRSFQNMKIGFDLSIDQTGSTFTGKGRKISENGRNLPAKSRTPIQVKGSINGDTIEATFIEEGTARKSNGRFVWRIDRSGRGLTGNFATTAARSRGKSAATRSL